MTLSTVVSNKDWLNHAHDLPVSGEMASLLKTYAETANVPVVVTNQITTALGVCAHTHTHRSHLVMLHHTVQWPQHTLCTGGP